MARVWFEEHQYRLSVTLTPSPVSRAFMALLLLVLLWWSVAISLEFARVLRLCRGMPSVGGFLIVSGIVLIAWLGVASSGMQFLGSNVITLSEHAFTVERLMAGRVIGRKESPVGELSVFVRPVQPPFLSLRVSPVHALVLNDAAGVGISRNITGGTAIPAIEERFSSLLSRRRGESSLSNNGIERTAQALE